jgi:mono/diheme cytochrome c family protein
MARGRLVPLLSLALLLGVGLASCSDLGDPIAPLPAPEDEEPPPPLVSFAAAVLPVLQARCVGCHFPDMAVRANIVGVPAAGAQYGGALRVAAGDTTASVLYQKIRGNPAFGSQMPLLPPPLAAEQIALVGQWIVEGALDN